jgi:MFS transporter, FSR family, fosmidomycin resistance protein
VPLLSGLLGDAVGLPVALAAVSCIALTTVPMVWALRPAFRSG